MFHEFIPYLGLIGILLAFALNTSYQTRKEHARTHDEDIAYRTRVLSHMAIVETRLARLETHAEKSASSGASTEARLVRIEENEKRFFLSAKH